MIMMVVVIIAVVVVLVVVERVKVCLEGWPSLGEFKLYTDNDHQMNERMRERTKELM